MMNFKTTKKSLLVAVKKLKCKITKLGANDLAEQCACVFFINYSNVAEIGLKVFVSKVPCIFFLP